MDRAVAAQRDWRSSSLDDRVAVCERFLAELESRRDSVAADITGMMGKPLGQSQNEINAVRPSATSLLRHCHVTETRSMRCVRLAVYCCTHSNEL